MIHSILIILWWPLRIRSMGKPKKILFIGHEASLSGAPILLLNIINVLKNDPEIEMKIVLKRGGILLNDYKKKAPTVQIKSDGYRKHKNTFYNLADIIFSKCNFLKAAWWCFKADIIFNNTITNGRLLHQLQIFKKPVITYVHELREVAKIFEEKKDTGFTIRFTDFFCCPSATVSSFLTEVYNVPESKKIIFPYYFPFSQYIHSVTEQNKASFKKQYAEKYSISPNTIWVVNMGKVSTRKGYDIFIDIGEKCAQQQPGKFSFIWVGGAENSTIEKELEANNLKLLENNIHFIGILPHSYDSLLPFDIFLLSSREDPYPLVVLEAAFQKVPAICFEDAGGIKEFIGEDAGWVMPDFSEKKVVEKLIWISLFLPEIRNRAEIALKKVLQLHGDENKMTASFHEILNRAKAGKKIEK
jgi:glycosyltransferase involved in cell wall biosynthesis